jgi:hypothetical protein
MLTNKGQPASCIVAGPQDRIAAESLRDHIEKEYGISLEIVTPGDADARKQECRILIGTPRTNSVLADVLKEHAVSFDSSASSDEAYLLRTVTESRGPLVLAAGTGKSGVFYAVGELKNYFLQKRRDGLFVLRANVDESPAFKYRWLWTWDWRMEWGGTEPGGVTMGEGEFKKRPESFLTDYKACIDFMAENGLNGLIIWGFLRDAHGGIAASQEICRYAEDRGVRILPGVGTSGYRGYYFEGDHVYNAPTWIKRHPELESKVLYEGKFVPGCLCPSKPENKKWLADGARWLFDTFAIGGVNLEMGDFFVCPCPDCEKARAAIASDEPDYYKDMAICLKELIPVMRAAAPDAWLSYATYTGFNREMMARPPKFIELIPPDAICQWTITGMMGNKDIPDPMTPLADWPQDLRPMAAHNIGYLHWANKSTSTESDFFIRRLQAAAVNSARSGLEGYATYGEIGDDRPNMFLNYLAFKEFAFHPEMTIEEFSKRRLAPLYGEKHTAELWRIIDLISGVPKEKRAAAFANALPIAESAARAIAGSAAAEIPSEYHDHWTKLLNFLKVNGLDPK